jgi:hypothetical protein
MKKPKSFLFDPERFQKGVIKRWIQNPIFRSMVPRLIFRAWNHKYGKGSSIKGMVELLCSEFSTEEQARIVDEWLDTFDAGKANMMLKFITESLEDKVYERRLKKILDSIE